MNKGKTKIELTLKMIFILNRLASQEQDRIHLWQRLELMSLETQNH
jgi:hypothetical protein